MSKEIITTSLENIFYYFNNEMNNIKSVECVVTDESDLWSDILKIYECDDQDQIVRAIEKVSQQTWSIEEKILCQILLASQCIGSDEFMCKLRKELRQYHDRYSEEDNLIVELGGILIDRIVSERKRLQRIELDQLHEVINSKEKNVIKAKNNLNDHLKNRR